MSLKKIRQPSVFIHCSQPEKQKFKKSLNPLIYKGKGSFDYYLQTMTFQILPIIFNKIIAIIAHFYVLFFGIFYLT